MGGVYRPKERVIYGPYLRKDGRKHVIIVEPTGVRRTVSYPKWLVEQGLGRNLDPNETVDHIDRDFTNDALNNLRVVPRSRHAVEDAQYAVPVVLTCISCGLLLVRARRNVNGNARHGRAGPFCKRCAGRYGAAVQNGRIARLSPQSRVVYKYVRKCKAP